MDHPVRTVAFIIALFLLGFVFPIFFIAAAALAFSIYKDISNPIVSVPPKEDSLKPLTELTGEDDNWLDRFHDICESPAETSFLDVMVSTFDLKPKKGLLLGGGVKLQMQVPVSSYRLDFLVDDLLIVEVDGAAYHSSPEAVERDRIRDISMTRAGFVVLRIPAKITLYRPQEAVERVRVARAETIKIVGERQAEEVRRKEIKLQEMKERFRPRQMANTLKNATNAVVEGLDNANSYVAREHKKLKEREKLEAEQKAEDELKQIQAEKDAEPELRKMYEELMADWGGK